jgi:hypothetical protein
MKQSLDRSSGSPRPLRKRPRKDGFVSLSTNARTPAPGATMKITAPGRRTGPRRKCPRAIGTIDRLPETLRSVPALQARVGPHAETGIRRSLEFAENLAVSGRPSPDRLRLPRWSSVGSDRARRELDSGRDGCRQQSGDRRQVLHAIECSAVGRNRRADRAQLRHGLSAVRRANSGDGECTIDRGELPGPANW